MEKYIIKSKDNWNALLNEHFNYFNDIYFTYEYFELYRRNFDVEPEAFYWSDNYISVFLPHLIRNVSNFNNSHTQKLSDLISPYGYCGPLIKQKCNTNFPDSFITSSLHQFFKDYHNYCKEKNYVCEFIRYHPLCTNNQFFDEIINNFRSGSVIYINLNDTMDALYGNIKKGTRYNIRTTEKRGCKIEFVDNPSKDDITDFLKCYREMLLRNNAPEKYNFDRKFIEDTFSLLDAFMLKATYQGNCVGAYIYLKGPKILHNHLGGALRLKGIFPGDLIYMKAIEFAKKEGFEYFMLGGGTGTDDSLFKYKLNFSSLIKPFYIGKMVYLPEIYNKLVEEKNLLNVNSDYFPKYRYNSDKTIV